MLKSAARRDIPSALHYYMALLQLTNLLLKDPSLFLQTRYALFKR
jgi:hypothetical protein